MESSTATINPFTPHRKSDTKHVLIALLPGLLAFGWLVSKAQWFWTHKPEMQFGWIVLMLSAFLLWDQWNKRPAPAFRARWPFFVFGAGGLAMLFLMQIYQAAFGMMPAVLMGLSVGVYAVAAASIHYVYGWPGCRFFAFPLLFFLIALPLPSFLYSPIVNGLQQKVASVNVEILNLVGIPARQVGSLIHLPGGTVGVNEACSGIRSLQSTIMATLFIGHLTLRRGSLQFALFALGIFLALFGNLVRSLYLSFTANAHGVAAVEQVHDSAGWTILLFTAGGVALSAWLFHRAEKWSAAEQARARGLSPSPKVA
ncbi:MAG TPA: exosortase/archaeosortase family protein [Verrucomicrobiae bacterium]|nr:exosortase/archaeosortase family protein [Verrucomicrobiae bacterium]